MAEKLLSQQDDTRLAEYRKNKLLFEGNHFSAFNIGVKPGGDTGKAKQKYIVCNFPQLMSYIIAEYLFGEEPKIYVKDEKDNEWLQALLEETQFNLVMYESAVTSTSLGDTCFKIRTEVAENGIDEKIFIEEMQPSNYFPVLDQLNVKTNPKMVKVVVFYDKTVGNSKKDYVYIETHEPYLITEETFEYNAAKSELGTLLSSNSVETNIDRVLVEHVPNTRIGNTHFGTSDYKAIESVLYAYNKRMSKNDEILDKHANPILAVGEGVIGEDGKVKKRAFDMIEVPENSKGMVPQYIVWDASLQSSYEQITKLLDLLFINSEISPATFARTEGSYPESGRALLFHLLPTLRKRNRKRLYYNKGIKNILYTAQVLAKERKISINGIKPPQNPTYPQIEWNDGIVNDVLELIEQEAKRIEAGLSTRADSIQRIDGISEEAARAKADEVKSEQGDFSSFLDTMPTDNQK